MKFRVDIFNGNGKHTSDYFQTENEANQFAADHAKKHPTHILFLLREITDNMYDVVEIYK